eukprot:363412-Chlamydomonas_euryale.AAC.6
MVATPLFADFLALRPDCKAQARFLGRGGGIVMLERCKIPGGSDSFVYPREARPDERNRETFCWFRFRLYSRATLGPDLVPCTHAMADVPLDGYELEWRSLFNQGGKSLAFHTIRPSS